MTESEGNDVIVSAEITDTSETLDALETPAAPETPETSDALEAQETPETSETPEVPDGAGGPAPTPEKPLTEEEKKKTGARKPILFVALGIVILTVLALILVPRIAEQRRIKQYNEGAAYLEQGDYEQAQVIFEELGDYDDAPVLALYAQKGIAYTAAQEEMEQGAFEAARSAFRSLSGFKDSEALADECDRAIAYAKGKELVEAGDYAAALDVLAEADGYADAAQLEQKCRIMLDQAEILDAIEREDYSTALTLLDSEAGRQMENREELVEECSNALSYLEAEQAYDDGLYFTAFEQFKQLGSYKDAQTRADSCVRPKPANGETYHNPSYNNQSCSLQINPNSNDGSCTYFKIYAVSGGSEVLVSCVFIHSGKTVTVRFPAGTYVFKAANSFGDWYGDKEMFGSNGTYSRLTSDDGDRFSLSRGSYVLTLSNASNGNVGSNSENRNTF